MNIATKPNAPAGPANAGTFTVGSTLRHVLNMTVAGSIGLVAVFFVDFLTLLYISRLGDTNLTAAVGYASQMIFLLISVNIGSRLRSAPSFRGLLAPATARARSNWPRRVSCLRRSWRGR